MVSPQRRSVKKHVTMQIGLVLKPLEPLVLLVLEPLVKVQDMEKETKQN